MTDAPSWGEPPAADVLVGLLRERHEQARHDGLRVDVLEDGLALQVEDGARSTEFQVIYLQGASAQADPWDLVVDALDALFGQWLEGGRDHRALPSGDEVEHDGVSFRVRIEAKVPALERMADQLLQGH